MISLEGSARRPKEGGSGSCGDLARNEGNDLQQTDPLPSSAGSPILLSTD